MSIEPTETILIMKGIGGTVKWPKKMKSPPNAQDSKRWCEFHNNHGHQMYECVALRLDVAELLNQGHLKDLLTDKGRVNRDIIIHQ